MKYDRIVIVPTSNGYTLSAYAQYETGDEPLFEMDASQVQINGYEVQPEGKFVVPYPGRETEISRRKVRGNPANDRVVDLQIGDDSGADAIIGLERI